MSEAEQLLVFEYYQTRLLENYGSSPNWFVTFFQMSKIDQNNDLKSYLSLQRNALNIQLQNVDQQAEITRTDLTNELLEIDTFIQNIGGPK